MNPVEWHIFSTEVTSVRHQPQLQPSSLPQHAVAISRRQVFAVWTDTDGPDACPDFCCLSIARLDLCIHACYTPRIQQGTSVSIDVDYIQKILQSNEGQKDDSSQLYLKCSVRKCWILGVKLTWLRTFGEWICVCVQSSMRHTLTVLSAEQVRNAPDDKPAASSPGTSGNTCQKEDV